MARQFRLWQNAQIVSLLPAAADAAGRTSLQWINVKYGHKIFLVCEVNQGVATSVTFTPLQATSLTGANSKALTNPAPIANVDNTAATDLFTVTTDGTRTGPVQYGTSFPTSTTVSNKMVIFEIDPDESMDINNTTVGPFNHIGIQTGASSASNITSVRAIIMPLRDARQNPPTTYV